MNKKIDHEYINNLKRLAATDRQEQILEELLTISYEINDNKYVKKVLHHSAQVNRLKILQLQGTEDIETIIRLRNKISLNTLELIDLLPIHDNKLEHLKSLLGVSVQRLRTKVFFLLFVQKIVLLFFIFSFYFLSGFDNEEVVTFTVITIILFSLIFSIYLSKDVKVKNLIKKDDIRVSRLYSRSIMGFTVTYLIVSIVTLALKAVLNLLTVIEVILILGFMECLLGVFIGKVLLRLYDAPPQKAVVLELEGN